MGFCCASAAHLRSEVSESTTPPVLPTKWVGMPRPRSRGGLSIYSILLIMLLSVSVLSSIVVGIIGYLNGTEALRAIAYDRLVEIRENRSREVSQLFATIENSVRLSALNETSKQAARAFTEGFDDLENQPLTDSQKAAVNAYYRDTFAADLSKATGEEVDGSTFVPRDSAEGYLQYNYVIPYASW